MKCKLIDATTANINANQERVDWWTCFVCLSVFLIIFHVFIPKKKSTINTTSICITILFSFVFFFFLHTIKCWNMEKTFFFSCEFLLCICWWYWWNVWNSKTMIVNINLAQIDFYHFHNVVVIVPTATNWNIKITYFISSHIPLVI